MLNLVPHIYSNHLRLLHVRISLEGVEEKTVLEAKSNLTYTFAWDRRNVYKQKVYGYSIADISIGYEYVGCPFIFRTHRRVEMEGYNSKISQLGNWNLNIHHHFDLQSGIVSMGDGSTLYLKHSPLKLIYVLGGSERRPENCLDCSSSLETAQLLQPKALTASPDGSLFVGDFNLIRKIAFGNVNSIEFVFELTAGDPFNNYYMAVNPKTAELFVSLPLRKQIWKISNGQKEIFAGSGHSCIVESICGDGGAAANAQLNEPKGIVFDTSGNLYIADGKSIRVISQQGLISTIVDGRKKNKSSGPIRCKIELDVAELELNWPSALAFNPITNRILFVDSDVVYELITRQTVRILLGQPTHCDVLETISNQTFRPLLIHAVRSIAVNDFGELYIAETDEKRLNQVRKLTTKGTLTLVAGQLSNCDCDPKNCPCDDSMPVAGPEGHLHSPVSITYSPDGNLYVADQGNNKIKAIKFALPALKMRTYEVFNPIRNEMFVFNRLGHHVHTVDTLNGRYLYNFTYDTDTSYGKLIQVTGSGGHKLYINRRNSQILNLEDVKGQKTQLHMNYDQRLVKLSTSDGAGIRMTYSSEVGLLKSILGNGKQAAFFDYDSYGRVIQVASRDRFAKLERKLVANFLSINFSDADVAYIAENRYLKAPIEINFFNGISININNNSSLQFDHQSTMLRKKTFEPLGSQKVEWRMVHQANGKQKRVAQVCYLFLAIRCR